MPKAAAEAKGSPEAFILASIGGFIDAVGVLTLGGLFVAHMSGNTAAMGAFFGQGEWSFGWPHLYAVPIFIAGLLIGYTGMLSSPTARRCGLLLSLEAAFLLAFAIIRNVMHNPATGTFSYFLVITPPLLAMGLQNALLREIGRTVFASTYVTGVIDMFAHSLSSFFVQGRDPGQLRLACRAAGIWCSYVAGALFGSVSLLFLGTPILFLPVLILVPLAIYFLRLSQDA